jgi:DNA-binding HxlR family transcriptional regulator
MLRKFDTLGEKLCFDLILRHSIGYRQNTAHLSLTDYVALSGMCKQTILDGLTSLSGSKKKLVMRTPHDDSGGDRAKTEYRVRDPERYRGGRGEWSLDGDEGSAPWITKQHGYCHAQKGTPAQIKARQAAYRGPRYWWACQMVNDTMLQVFDTLGEKLCFDLILRHSVGCSQYTTYLSLIDLANLSHLSKSTVIRSLPSLSEKELVRRIEHDGPYGDRSKTEYRVTAAGLGVTPQPAALEGAAVMGAGFGTATRVVFDLGLIRGTAEGKQRVSWTAKAGRGHMIPRDGGETVPRGGGDMGLPGSGETIPPYKEGKISSKGKGNNHQDDDDKVRLRGRSSSHQGGEELDIIRGALSQEAVRGVLKHPVSEVRLDGLARSIFKDIYVPSGLNSSLFVEWMEYAAEITASSKDVRSRWSFFEGVLRNVVCERVDDTPPDLAASQEQEDDDAFEGYMKSKYAHLYK